MSDATELPLPFEVEEGRFADWDDRVDVDEVRRRAIDWRQRQGLRAAGQDERRTVLFLVDLQKDFCLPDGTLFVAGRGGRGAIEDGRRIVEFLYRRLPSITEVICTLDTHYPNQIFSSTFWRDESGEPPPPHTQITAEDVAAGRYRPDPELAPWLAPGGDPRWLERQVLFYCRELEREGKYTLYLWPPHCLHGSPGHDLVGPVEEARLFHAFARSAPARLEIKGGNPLTENYSALAPEVLGSHDGRALDGPNEKLIESLLDADRLIVAGEAASHCVKATLEDLLVEIGKRDPALARRVYLMTDCTSPVVVPEGEGGQPPGADFTEVTEEAFERFADAGVNLVESTTPVEEWPGFP